MAFVGEVLSAGDGGSALAVAAGAVWTSSTT